MMEQGVADTTVVQMLVDTLGLVEQVKVGVSSEDETVDQAALRVRSGPPIRARAEHGPGSAGLGQPVHILCAGFVR